MHTLHYTEALRCGWVLFWRAYVPTALSIILGPLLLSGPSAVALIETAALIVGCTTGVYAVRSLSRKRFKSFSFEISTDRGEEHTLTAKETLRLACFVWCQVLLGIVVLYVLQLFTKHVSLQLAGFMDSLTTPLSVALSLLLFLPFACWSIVRHRFSTFEIRVSRSQLNPPLTNAAVLGLKAAGLGDDVIISKIRNSPASFEVNPQNIIELHEAGLSDAVISAMVETGMTGKRGRR